MEQNSLDEFVQLASLSKRKFEAERRCEVIFTDARVVHSRSDDPKNSVAMVNVFIGDKQNQFEGEYLPLTIPRRPAWSKSMSGHEIE